MLFLRSGLRMGLTGLLRKKLIISFSKLFSHLSFVSCLFKQGFSNWLKTFSLSVAYIHNIHENSVSARIFFSDLLAVENLPAAYNFPRWKLPSIKKAIRVETQHKSQFVFSFSVFEHFHVSSCFTPHFVFLVQEDELWSWNLRRRILPILIGLNWFTDFRCDKTLFFGSAFVHHLCFK